MANKEDLRIAVVKDGLKIRSLAILDALNDAADYAVRLTDAQDGGTVLAWSRTLYGVGDTGSVTLIVDSAAKTVKCQTGAGLFANFRVGRDVQLTSFVNAGNNQTTEITARPDDDTITIGSATGLVNETDTSARAQENTTAEEQAIVTAIVAVRDRFSEGEDFLDNVAVSTANRRADLMDWIW